MAGFCALRHPDRFAGLVIASSRLKHEFLEEELRSGNLPATLFLHSEADASTPLSRTKEGMELLQRSGGNAELFEHDAGHRLPPEALRFLDDWQQRQGLGRQKLGQEGRGQ